MTKFNEKVVLVYGSSPELDLFTYELESGFNKLGYDTFAFDSQNLSTAIPNLIQFLIKPGKCHAVIGFNGIGLGIALDNNSNFWKQAGVPYVDILLDTPLYYHSDILDDIHMPQAVLCIDKEHADYILNYCKNIQLSGFLPHGGTYSRLESKPIKERSIDLLYAGGNLHIIGIPDNPKASIDYPFNFKNLLNETAEYILKNPSYTAITATDVVLDKKNIQLPAKTKMTLYKDSVVAEARALTLYRYNILKKLAESGISITLCGSNWEYTDIVNYNNVTFLGKIAPQKVLDLMTDSKIVLNNMAWFKAGSHERIFNSMLAKAVCVSDRTTYLEETFVCSKSADEDKRELVLYDLFDVENLVNNIKELLESNDTMQNIADRGFCAADQKHTWYNRAKEIAEDLFPCLSGQSAFP